MRPPLVHLEHALGLNVVAAEKLAGALGSDELESGFAQPAGDWHDFLLVAIGDANKDPAARRQYRARPHLRLEESRTKIRANPHHFTRRFHFRTQQAVGSGKFHKGQDRFLDRDMIRNNLFGKILLPQAFADHDPGGDLRQWPTNRLADERHRARGPWIDLDYIDLVLVYSVLHIHQTDHVEPSRQCMRMTTHRLDMLSGGGERR